MKIIKSVLVITGTLFSLLFFQSCLDDDTYANDMYPNALVTVKEATDKTVFLQLDEKTTLLPVNIKSAPFGSKEVRALVNYKKVDESSKDYSEAVYVNWIDSIRTKTMVTDLGAEDDVIYGNDPVEIIKDWVTIAEDGYLTLRFRIAVGNETKIHYMNLLAGVNPENPYEVELRHNADGDITGGRVVDGLIAFKLDKLPDTNGKTVKLKLNWKSFDGDKSFEFDYSTRASSASKLILPDSRLPRNIR